MDQRGDHDINRAFVFRSNEQFIFHDSPGFEAGDEAQLKKVQSFIDKRAKATEVDEQLHAIWLFLIPYESVIAYLVASGSALHQTNQDSFWS